MDTNIDSVGNLPLSAGESVSIKHEYCNTNMGCENNSCHFSSNAYSCLDAGKCVDGYKENEDISNMKENAVANTYNTSEVLLEKDGDAVSDVPTIANTISVGKVCRSINELEENNVNGTHVDDRISDDSKNLFENAGETLQRNTSKSISIKAEEPDDSITANEKYQCKEVTIRLDRLSFKEIILHCKGFDPKSYTERRRVNFHCPFCDFHATALSLVCRHSERHHSKFKTISCKICSKSFFFMHELYGHHRMIHDNKGFKCRFCDRVMKSEHGRNIHEANHTGEKKYDCQFCEKRFSSSHAALMHTRHNHTNDRPYDCNFCLKSFHTHSILTLHKRLHTSEQPYKCSFCPKKFSANANRKAHERRLHTGERPFPCTKCKSTFYTKSDLNTHKWLHLPGDQAPYQCDKCGRGFNRRDIHANHVNVCKGERGFECDICNQLFNFLPWLEKHKNIHHS